jgi:hypothetical protein
MGIFIKNNADRRSGIEGRVLSYTHHIPERISGKERREVVGRRNEKGFMLPIVFKQVPFSQNWNNT